MTLRRRLVLAVAAVASIIVASVVALLAILSTSLRDELDKQVISATRELIQCRAAPTARQTSSELPQLDRPVVSDQVPGGGVCGATQPASDGAPPLLAHDIVEAHATNLSSPIRPFDAVSDGGSYRAAAVRVADGRFLVAALPTGHIDATFRRVVAGSMVVGVLLLLAVALGAWWVERLGLRPIRQVAAAADAVASGDTGHRVDPPQAGAEAGHLARAFNVMVDERQAIEDKLRRFVADASHELRTPLTTIAGVLELYTSGSLVGADLDESMRRAGSEARRMTGLVDELLLLTQLDAESPLADDDVDLAELVRDAAIDVALLQPDRPITVDVAGRAIVRGDEARLRQVITNLVANALTHTPPSTRLRIAVRTDDGTRVIEVDDDGPGLTAEQAERVFDRFYRVAPGRHRRAGGSGLGLSIVQSIVSAHHGGVTVAATPAHGCCFRVSLPAADFDQTSRIQTGPFEIEMSRSEHDQTPINQYESNT